MKLLITYECLDFAVYDLGMVEACKQFNILEQKANQILFTKVTTKIPERYQYVKPAPEKLEVPTLSNDVKKLVDYINKNYNKILDVYKARNHTKIDRRSNSSYDRAMEALTNLLYYNADYIYTDDEATEAYIHCKMTNGISVKRVKALRYQEMWKDMDYLDSQTSNDYSADDCLNLFKKLTETQLDVVNLLVCGYNQVEIAEKMGVKRQVVNDRLRRARKKVLK